MRNYAPWRNDPKWQDKQEHGELYIAAPIKEMTPEEILAADFSEEQLWALMNVLRLSGYKVFSPNKKKK
ncbi:hypothetical protein [Rouxiella sp. WC2420]|uniref:Uncharacterized protein n=1 Tax=Rouxiella sp. WC2420 TaxID=3234145 RepID=A0AB39VNI7_9GAMM